MKSILGNYKRASSLAIEQNACLCKGSRFMNIAVPFRFMGSYRRGIKEILDTRLGIYHEELKGVLIAYNKKTINFVGSYGDMYGVECVIHFKIVWDYIVFVPTIDSVLQGVVNNVTSKFIGCLVYGYFQATSNYVTPIGTECNGIEVGDTVKLRVTKLTGYFSDVLSITGEILLGLRRVKNDKALPKRDRETSQQDVATLDAIGKNKKDKPAAYSMDTQKDEDRVSIMTDAATEAQASPMNIPQAADKVESTVSENESEIDLFSTPTLYTPEKMQTSFDIREPSRHVHNGNNSGNVMIASPRLKSDDTSSGNDFERFNSSRKKAFELISALIKTANRSPQLESDSTSAGNDIGRNSSLKKRVTAASENNIGPALKKGAKRKLTYQDEDGSMDSQKDGKSADYDACHLIANNGITTNLPGLASSRNSANTNGSRRRRKIKRKANTQPSNPHGFY